MKKLKRAVAVLLTAAMIFSSMPMAAFAATDDDLLDDSALYALIASNEDDADLDDDELDELADKTTEEEKTEAVVSAGDSSSDTAVALDDGETASGYCGRNGGKNIQWSLEDGILTISGSGEMADWSTSWESPWIGSDYVVEVIVEGEISNIGSTAFYNCKNLKKVEISDSVTSIGHEAFSGCASLTYIDLPSNLKEFSYNVFGKCTSLESVDLPDGLITIGASVFEGCTSLREINLPDGLETLGRAAFYNCTNLKEVELPGSLTYIDQDIFYGSGLTSIVIQGGITSISNLAFFSCTSLKTIKFTGECPEFGTACFSGVTATAYYPYTWTEVPDSNAGSGSITWIAYDPETGAIIDPDPSVDPDTCSHLHTTVVNKKAATETEDGYTGDTVCSDCGTVLVEGLVIPATGGGGDTCDTEEIIPTVENQINHGYGTHSSGGTRTKRELVAKEVQKRAEEYVKAINDYYSAFRRAINKERKATASEGMSAGEKLRSWNESASDDEKLFTTNILKTLSNKQVNAIYETLAMYFDEYASEGEKLGCIDFDDDEIKISANIIKKIRGKFDFDNYTQTVNGCSVQIKMIRTSFVPAVYSGYIYVDGRMAGGIVSSTDQTAKALETYLNELEDWASDATHEAFSSIFKDMVKINNFSDLSESEIESILEDKAAILKNRGFGDAMLDLLGMRKSYSWGKRLINASSMNSDSILSDMESIYEEIDGVEYTDDIVSQKSISIALDKVKDAKKLLCDSLWNYYVSKVSTDDDKTFVSIVWDKIKEKFSDVESAFDYIFGCPVNVYVYDVDGTELGHIEDDEVEFDSDKIYMQLTGDVKNVWIPSGIEAEIKLVGTDTGEMTYVAEQIQNGVAIKRANYYAIPLTEDCEYTQEITGNEKTVEDLAELTGTNGTYSPDEYLLATDETAHIEVSGDVEGNGTIAGTGLYPKGDPVILLAMPDDENSVFDGWYVDGEFVSLLESYQFMGLEDINVTAKFKQRQIDDTEFSASMSEKYDEIAEIRLSQNADNMLVDDIIITIPETESDVLTVNIKKYLSNGSTSYEENVSNEFDGVCRFAITDVDLLNVEKLELYDENNALICTIKPTDASDDATKPTTPTDPSASQKTSSGGGGAGGGIAVVGAGAVLAGTAIAAKLKSDKATAALPDSSLIRVTENGIEKAFNTKVWGKKLTVSTEANTAVLTGSRSYIEQLSAQGIEQITLSAKTSDKILFVWPVTKKTTVNVSDLLNSTPQNGTFKVVLE